MIDAALYSATEDTDMGSNDDSRAAVLELLAERRAKGATAKDVQEVLGLSQRHVQALVRELWLTRKVRRAPGQSPSKLFAGRPPMVYYLPRHAPRAAE
jgi:predicted ArsR family transcriptional regulator